VNSDSPITSNIDDEIQMTSIKKLKEENRRLSAKVESMQSEYNSMLYQMSSIILSKSSAALKESEMLHIRRMFGQNYCQIVENYFAIISNFHTKFESTRHTANIIVRHYVVAKDTPNSEWDVHGAALDNI
jgi:hypothetical protein